MFRLFINSSQIHHHTVTLTRDTYHHLFTVIKFAPKDCLQLVLERTSILTVRIDAIAPLSFTYTLLKEDNIRTSSRLHITLAQALPKQDKMTDILKRCTEIGVSEFIPISTERSISRPDPKRVNHKMNRWKNTLISASSQSQRTEMPILHHLKTLQEFITYIKTTSFDMMIVPWEEEALHHPLKLCVASYKAPQTICIMIGPEGGLSLLEVKALTHAGFKTCSLGLHILRVENAGFFAISQVLFALGK